MLEFVFFMVWQWVGNRTYDRITSILMWDSVKKASKIDYASYDSPEFYDRIQKGWSLDGQRFVASAQSIFNTLSCIAGMAAYAAILAYVDWKLFLVLILLRIAFTPIDEKTGRMIYRFNNKLAEQRRKESYYRSFFDNKGMAAEGKIFDLYSYARENYISANKKIYKQTFIFELKIKGIKLLSEVMWNLPIAAVYIYLSVCAYNGTVSLGDMTMCIAMYVGFINQLYNTIANITGFRNDAERARFSREFLAPPTTICADGDESKPKVDSGFAGHTVEFCGVSFAYLGIDKKVLDNVSFKVGSNKTVSVIGANGAGKTTLVHLLMRLYDPTEGVILLDGRDLREYSASSLYEIFGVLFQDYCDYAVSAWEFVTLSTVELDVSRFSDALKSSTSYKFINSLKNGINTAPVK